MIYLVDGNNVMAQIPGWHRDKAEARKRLIRVLARFVSGRRTRVTVVFDGSPDDEFPEGCKYKGVAILYAKPGSDADSRIRELVEKSSRPRDMVVVSSDKALASGVSHRGAQVMSSFKFRAMLGEAEKQQQEKPGEHEPVDLDEWLDIFGTRKE